MKPKFTKIFILIAGLLTLSNCDPAVKKYLGIDKKAPDEYSVVKSSPLSVPPNFDLTPPGENTKQSQEQISKNSDNEPLTNNDKMFLKKTNKITHKKQAKTIDQQ